MVFVKPIILPIQKHDIIQIFKVGGVLKVEPWNASLGQSHAPIRYSCKVSHIAFPSSDIGLVEVGCRLVTTSSSHDFH